jgi:hypothetical protein
MPYCEFIIFIIYTYKSCQMLQKFTTIPALKTEKGSRFPQDFTVKIFRPPGVRKPEGLI